MKQTHMSMEDLRIICMCLYGASCAIDIVVRGDGFFRINIFGKGRKI